MPYPGVPSHLTKKMERCVNDVMRKQKLPKGRAIAICKTSIVGKKKDYTKYEQAGLVEMAWSDINAPGWIAHVFDDYVIVRMRGKYFKVEYELLDGGDVKFADSAQQVEQTWTPTKAEGVMIPPNYHVTRPVLGAELSVAIPNAPIRSINDNRYVCHAIMFGSPDVRDLYKQYFDENTEFCLDWYKTRPWLYHHGIHPLMGAEKIGEWDTVGIDDVGVFLEGERYAHHKYSEAVESLLEEEMLYPSSGALSYLVRVEEDGHIAQWPIAEVSSTVAPAEFRMGPITEAAVKAFDTIYGGSEMGTLKEFLDALKSAVTVKSDADGETEPVDEEEVEDENVDEEVDVDELVATMASAIGLENYARAVKAIDTLAHELDVRLEKVEKAQAMLAKQETERVKSFATGDWTKELFSVTRSADVEGVEEGDKLEPSGDVETDGVSDVFAGIFNQ